MHGNHVSVIDKVKAWGLECTQRGIVLEMFWSLDDGKVGMDQFLRPHGLCVFVENASARTQEELLVRSARDPEIAVLLCPAICPPMTRFMVLHDQSNPDTAYLESVARLCTALEVHPIILIVAQSEREAHLRQGYAEGVCNSFRLRADFDIAIDCDLRSAVRHVASWHGCSHLIAERPLATSWWQGFHGNRLEQLRRLSDSLSLLALPKAIVLDAPRQIRSNRFNLFTNRSEVVPNTNTTKILRRGVP